VSRPACAALLAVALVACPPPPPRNYLDPYAGWSVDPDATELWQAYPVTSGAGISVVIDPARRAE